LWPTLALAQTPPSGWQGLPQTAPAPAEVPAATSTPDAAPASAPDPAAASADHAAGLQRLHAGDLGEAVELLKRAVARDPGRAAYACDLGFVLVRLGARREAEALYLRALALEPGDARAYIDLADLLASSPERWQRHQEVLALLERGAQAVSDDGRSRQQLALATARFEQSVGRVAEARRRLEALARAPATPVVRKQTNDLLEALAEDERALALADWPAVPLDGGERARLTEIERALDEAPARALERASALVAAHPTSAAARFARARALVALHRFDLADRELTLLLQLQPSHAEGWRLLGMVLTEHGSAIDSARADEALRRALALEPSWEELRTLRRRLGERRLDPGPAPASTPHAPPSPRAQQLYEDAQRWLGGDTQEVARGALTEALADSPAFVEAAAALYALDNAAPAATETALWSDGEGLTRLAREFLRVRQDAETTELARRWLDRAVALGFGEALFARALLRAELEDGEGALADLAAYATSDVNPPRLAEARALRRSLAPTAPGRGAPVALARQLLLADRAREARRVLGGTCRPGLAAEVLVELGRIEEYEGRPREALACHRLALSGSGGAARAGALERIARIAARAPIEELRAITGELTEADAANIPAATWALARLGRADERWQAAAALAERFLAIAPPGDPLRAEAARAEPDLHARSSEERRTRAFRLRLSAIAGSSVALLGLALLLVRRLRGRTVAGALARTPDLYPDVAAVVAEVRHDVLKHRASALGMLGTTVTAREEIARALREPQPTSAVVANGYDRLRRAAAAAGVHLRPIEREPLFGPLQRALARAEALIDRAGNGTALAALDRDLRERHGPALAALLTLVPRTRLDPAQMADWLRNLAEADAGTTDGDAGLAARSNAVRLTPALHMQTLDLEVPLPADALHTIVANLVRNALSALRDSNDPRVLVRVEQQRDATGRRLVTVLVADSAEGAVSLDLIEQRDGQRGLGIVRDLVRRWGGHVVVRAEAAPFVKAVGAAFPMVAA
jgi:tetratricopeptide (TPR) repeat protein